jgi:hypothetical protein
VTDLTEQEIEMVEILRGWSEHRETHFTASCTNGIWECCVKGTAHPSFLEFHPECPPNAVFVYRGVGASFVEAFAKFDGNDIEPGENAAWP